MLPHTLLSLADSVVGQRVTNTQRLFEKSSETFPPLRGFFSFLLQRQQHFPYDLTSSHGTDTALVTRGT